ncbi:MAG: ATP-dependent RNA helicase HrpA, partial [Citrobacter freundii]|nr:ATP-dependent RNA helicase HrpA [Citrobacter freundii]
MTEQQKLTFNMLQQQLDSLMLRDRQRFARRLHGVKKVKNPDVKNPDAQQAIYQEMAKEIEQAAGKVVLREAARPKISYPENLPVSQKKQDILDAIRDHQVVIVAGETGSGKTTQLPKICMELGRGVKGLIGHTQPRRLAARTVANRIAEELQTEPGGCIGYKVRFSDHVSDNTMVKLMTDGILLAEIQQDRLLMQY